MRVDGVSKLVFEEADFLYDGRAYSYEAVSSIEFSATITKHSVNFIPTGESYEAEFVVGLEPEKRLAIKADTRLFGGMKRSGMEGLWRAKEMLSEITFLNRVQRFEDQFRSKGFFAYRNFQFHRDGDVFENGRRLFSIRSAEVETRLGRFQLEFTQKDESRFLSRFRRRRYIIDISTDRDCILYMLRAAYGFTFRDEPIREKKIATQRAFMEAVLSLGAKMVTADGSVDQRELSALKSHFRIGTETFPNAAKIFNDAIRRNEPARAIAERIAAGIGDNSDVLNFIVIGLAEVAGADGTLHPAERLVLREVASGFGFTPEQLEQLIALVDLDGGEEQQYSREEAFRAARSSDVHHHLRVLGLAAGVTFAEIRTAYKLMAKRYHPDSVRAQGLPDGEVERSQEILKTINLSYEWLQRHYA